MWDNGAKLRLRERLAALTALDGVSGHEGTVVSVLRTMMEGLADSIEIDALGNLYAHRNGGDGPHLMVEAHSDEIGCLVSDITPAGFLRFQLVGGTLESMLIGRKVRVVGRRGVVGVRPGHLQSGKSAVPGIEDLYIDLGFDSAKEVRSLGVQVGDQITWQSELEPAANEDRVIGKGIDNRIGCLLMVELLQELHGTPLPGPLTVVISVQEEVGLKGARVAAERVRPDVALVIDTVPSTDTPDAFDAHTFQVGLGRGPIFQVSSAPAASGFLMSEPVRAFLIEVAESLGIPYQLATFSFSETDGSAIYSSAGGISTAVVTIPRRYSHSPVEMLDLNDALATLRLAVEVARRAGEFPRGLLG
jgi:putative aminopeptidase